MRTRRVGRLYSGHVARVAKIWTWDVGTRDVDMDGDPLLVEQVLQTVLDGGLWNQFRKFPTDVIERLLPRLQLQPSTRAILEMWIEEAETRQAH